MSSKVRRMEIALGAKRNTPTIIQQVRSKIGYMKHIGSKPLINLKRILN